MVLYVKCSAECVCGCLLTWAGWSIRAAEALKVHRIILVHLHCICSGQQCLYLPLPFPSSGSEVAQLSIFPWEQPDVTAFAGKELWVDAWKPVNANEPSEITWWLLPSGAGPSIWRRLLPGFVVLGSSPAWCFYEGIVEGDLQQLFSLRSFLLPIKSVTTPILIFHGL